MASIKRHHFDTFANGADLDLTTAGPTDTPLSALSALKPKASTAAGYNSARGAAFGTGAAGEISYAAFDIDPTDIVAFAAVIRVPDTAGDGITAQQRLINLLTTATSTNTPHVDVAANNGRFLFRDAAHTTISGTPLTHMATGATGTNKDIHVQALVKRGTTTSNGEIIAKMTDITTLGSPVVLADSGLRTGINCGTVDFKQVLFGKPSALAGYTGTVYMDSIAVQGGATGLIDALGVEDFAGVNQTVRPFQTVTLSGVGAGPWSQVSGPAVLLTGSGATRTFVAPATVDGATLVFAYGTATVTVTVYPHSEWWGSLPVDVRWNG